MSSHYSSSGGTSGSNTVPEVLADPASPIPGQQWVLRVTPQPGGMAIGLLLALTHAGNGLEYFLSYYTTESTIVRTQLV